MADPWVAPDTQAAPATAPAAWSDAVLSSGHTAPVTTGVLPLRPLTIPDILDGALRAWKLAPATMALLAAVFVVPVQVVLGILSRDAIEDVELGQTFSDAFGGSSDVETGFLGDFYLVGVVVHGLTLALVAAAVARLMSGWYVGQRLEVFDLVRGSLRRALPLAGAWFLVHLLEAAFALMIVVPAIVPMTWYAVVTPVIACEGVGPIRAMRRSFRLCNRRFGGVLGVCLLVAAVDSLLSVALTALSAVYLELDLPAGWLVETAVSSAALLVTVPFVASAAALLYIDLRVRTEGLDIELAAGRRFA